MQRSPHRAGWKRLSHKWGRGGFFVHLHKNDTRNTANCQDQSGRVLWIETPGAWLLTGSEDRVGGGACPALHTFGYIGYIREGRSKHRPYDARHRLMGQPRKARPTSHAGLSLRIIPAGTWSLKWRARPTRLWTLDFRLFPSFGNLSSHRP